MSKRTTIILLVALGISVAINLFIAGAAGYYGSQFRGISGNPEVWIDRMMHRGEHKFLRELEGNDREVAKQIFAEHRPKLREAVREMHMARRDFIDVMRDNPEDISALTRTIDRSKAAAQLANESFHGTLRGLATGLSPEAIKELGKNMGQGARHERRKQRHRDRNDDY